MNLDIRCVSISKSSRLVIFLSPVNKSQKHVNMFGDMLKGVTKKNIEKSYKVRDLSRVHKSLVLSLQGDVLIERVEEIAIARVEEIKLS